ncbi:MAG: membrane protein insertase YidC [Pseudomonadales bacterium]|jgi:YidC/Oxa1 family membrane protein insertase|nr:membrane protein insertase YidC [Pseudomonadales bacterium]MDP6471422.1 membrane protein insertase YidC [Pseudomonadales bacterium]MDP6828591.1 membrane protein insertase YidC [Pseudomonadales bacterium]MDP6972015.1 membrane protein insertase YidC [Pseudomonadales bacterium]|tara:strand:+ start:3065 stop:4783 length:1719 start_codon:yes stop_codon:yes gene_type:complete
MFSAEVQRIILLVALAATGYLLILTWNDDYMQASAPTEHSQAPQVTGEARDDVPGVGATTDTTDQISDVPDASLIGTETETPQPSGLQAAASNNDRLIEVRTPSLRVWIDQLGGDFVRVQLPGYPVAIDRPDVPFQLLDVGNGYTYVGQSGLIGPNGLDGSGQRPRFISTSKYYDIDEGVKSVVLSAVTEEGVTVRKIFDFAADDFLVKVRYEIDNARAEAFQASLFAQIKRDGREPPGSEGFSMGPQPYLGAALTTPESRYEKLELDDLDEGTFTTNVTGGWMAFLQHYFLSAWVAEPEENNRYYGRRRSDGTYIVGYTGPLKTVAAGDTGKWQARFYAGPKDQKRLEQIAPNLNLTVDYGFLWWLAVPLFTLLDWFNSVAGNWGVAIILLTILVKGLLYPLSAKSYKSMANMRRIAPQMKKLQERHSDDRQKLSQEMMALYKKEGASPLGGCLPMLLPMPIFIALYWVLYESVELRHAPFMLWIDDLAAMDPYFVLPLLMGASMYVQQLLSPAVGDPMQVRMMKMMPVMFTVLFLFFPAGLVLYWLVNQVLGLAQQWWVIKQTEETTAQA